MNNERADPFTEETTLHAMGPSQGQRRIRIKLDPSAVKSFRIGDVDVTPEAPAEIELWMQGEAQEEKPVTIHGDGPRAYTTDEVLDQFLSHVENTVEYWINLVTKQPEQVPADTDSLRWAVEGAVFSILSTLDGAAMGLPGFIVAPSPHPADREYHMEAGENWYPGGVTLSTDIAGGLHELFGRERKP